MRVIQCTKYELNKNSKDTKEIANKINLAKKSVSLNKQDIKK